jgi:hypothetical protein
MPLKGIVFQHTDRMLVETYREHDGYNDKRDIVYSRNPLPTTTRGTQTSLYAITFLLRSSTFVENLVRAANSQTNGSTPCEQTAPAILSTPI